MVDLQTQYQKSQDEIDAAMREVMDSCCFVRGPQVSAFEQELSSYTGSPHVVSCASGTDALQLALMALDLQPGDEVITVPFTFVSTVEVIIHLGLKPVFVDVSPDTFNMDTEQIESAITERTKVVLPVHLFGQCVDMERVLNIARKYGLAVIEDACQSIGASVTFSDGTIHQAGTMGVMGCTSFFPSKNLGCYGDGGAVFVQDATMVDKVRMLANHGMPQRYQYAMVGLNSRLDTLQAAVLRVKLKHLNQYNESRQNAAKQYTRLLDNEKAIICPKRASYSSHVFHQYTIQLMSPTHRALLRSNLMQAGIPTAVYYPYPIHLQEAYRDLGYGEEDFPVSKRLAQSVLSLPMHTELSEEQVDYISKTLLQNL